LSGFRTNAVSLGLVTILLWFKWREAQQEA
jgi:hypothetical protein